MEGKKILGWISCLALLLSLVLGGRPSQAQKEEALDLPCDYHLSMNLTTGQVFFQEAADQPVAIASMSKLMTYLIIQEDLAQGHLAPETKVRISPSAAQVPGSSLNLRAGEVLSIQDLLDGLIIVSGNDAATALAQASTGSTKAFVARMNAKAQELGLDQSHFVNPSGLTEPFGACNTMSLRDFSLMVQHLVQAYPAILDYGNKPFLSQPQRGDVRRGSVPWLEEDGILGLKTGYTAKAMYCLSTIEQTEEGLLLGVVAHAPSVAARDQATRQLLDQSKERAKYQALIDLLDQVDKLIKTSPLAPGIGQPIVD